MTPSLRTIRKIIKRMQRRVKKMQADLDALYALVEPDLILTRREQRLLKQSRKNRKDGKLISAERMCRELRQ